MKYKSGVCSRCLKAAERLYSITAGGQTHVDVCRRCGTDIYLDDIMSSKQERDDEQHTGE